MRDQPTDSIGVGRWLGVSVRLHITWPLLVLVGLFLSLHTPKSFSMGESVLLLAVWFACVLWREVWRCVAVTRFGGMTEVVVLTPIGSMSQWTRFVDPRQALFVAMSGTLASFFGLMFVGSVIFAVQGDVPFGALNLLAPGDLEAGGNLFMATLFMLFWAHGLLLVVNLLPATATDVGRALIGLIGETDSGNRRGSFFVQLLSGGVVAGLLILAFFWSGDSAQSLVPAWFPLSALALFLLYHMAGYARTLEEEGLDDDLFGYDFSQGYSSLEHKVDLPEPQIQGPLGRWLERRRLEREERLQQIESDEERSVDSILARLHDEGIDSLSAEDRAVLNRVSARYRSRIGH